MRRIGIFSLSLFLLCIFSTKALAENFVSASFVTEKSTYDGGVTNIYEMLVVCHVYSNEYDITFRGGPISASPAEYLDYLSGYDGVYGDLYIYAKRYAYPAPDDPVWLKSYTFETLDYVGPGVNEQYYVDLTGGGVRQLDFVKNVSISEGATPTISWDGLNDTAVDNYTLQLWKITPDGKRDISSGPQFKQIFPAGSPSYSFEYTGDLFNEYDSLLVEVQATDRVDTGAPLYNRSVVYVLHSAEPLVAAAGPDQVVFAEVTLDGSNSYDLDGTIISWQWSLAHRTNTKLDRTAAGSNPRLTNLAPGFYDVVLTVTDNAGDTDTDSMLLGVAGRWDIDGDNKLGLSECIYILQILSGLKSDN